MKVEDRTQLEVPSSAPMVLELHLDVGPNPAVSHLPESPVPLLKLLTTVAGSWLISAVRKDTTKDLSKDLFQELFRTCKRPSVLSYPA